MSPASILKNLSILYIEDEKEIREETYNLLSKFTKKIIVGEDGQQGLSLLAENPDIDLIISDIEMPNLNGLKMLEKIRETDKDIACIFVTAHNSHEILLKAIQLKVDDCLIKPFNLKDLIQSTIKVAENVLNEKTVRLQYQEMKLLKHNIEENNIVIKISKNEKILDINDNFKNQIRENINFSFKSLFYYEYEYESLIQEISTLNEKGTILKNIFLSNNNGEKIRIQAEIILEKNLFLDEENLLIIMKDITKEHEENKSIKNNLIKKNSSIFQQGKESKAISETELVRTKQELSDSIETINKLEQRNKFLEEEYKKTELSIMDKLKFDKKSLENALKEKDLKIRNINNLLNNKNQIIEENESLKKELKEMKDELKILKIRIEELESGEELSKIKKELDSWQYAHGEMKKKNIEIEKKLKEAVKNSTLTSKLKEKIGLKK